MDDTADVMLDARLPWPPAAVAELVRLVAAGLTDKAIAPRVGRHVKAVEASRRRLGLRKHGRVRARVLALLAAGWHVRQVAAAVGRDEQHVRLIRRRAAG